MPHRAPECNKPTPAPMSPPEAPRLSADESTTGPREMEVRAVESELLQRMIFEHPATSELRSQRKACLSYRELLERRRAESKVEEMESPVSSTIHAFAPPVASVARNLDGSMAGCIVAAAKCAKTQDSTEHDADSSKPDRSATDWHETPTTPLEYLSPEASLDSTKDPPYVPDENWDNKERVCRCAPVAVLDRTPSDESLGSEPHAGSKLAGAIAQKPLEHSLSIPPRKPRKRAIVRGKHGDIKLQRCLSAEKELCLLLVA